MSGIPDTLVQLRDQLREHFPEAHAHTHAHAQLPENADSDSGDGDGDGDGNGDAAPENGSVFKTGVAALDRAGIPSGGITELAGRRASCGTGLLIHALLQAAADEKRHLALIDSRDRFDPGCADVDACRSLLWLRCEDVETSLKAVDLLLRDGNLPLVVADFQLESPRALRSVPLSSWHRLRALAEQTGVTLLLFTPAPLIPTARLRLELKARFRLDALNQPRAELLEDFPYNITRRLQHSASLAAAS